MEFLACVYRLSSNVLQQYCNFLFSLATGILLDTRCVLTIARACN